MLLASLAILLALILGQVRHRHLADDADKQSGIDIIDVFLLDVAVYHLLGFLLDLLLSVELTILLFNRHVWLIVPIITFASTT